MKCPKCGYNSFDHLDNCKKCDADLTEQKTKFNIRGFYAAGQATAAAPVVAEAAGAEPEDNGAVDFGFDFLEEEEETTAPADDENVSIDQPFGADSESVPADNPSDDDDNQSEKGPEFSL